MVRDADDVDDAVFVEGQDDARKAILVFLEKLSKNQELDGEVTLHLSQHGGPQEEVIYETSFEPTTGPGEMADELVERAVEDCEGLSAKKIKYTVKADGMPGRATFTLACSQPEEEDLEDIEDLPNRKGLMRQLMRHQESIMKLAIGAQKEAIATLKEDKAEKNSRIRDLEASQMANMKAYEELVNGRHMRDLELRKLDNSERRKDQVASILMQGAPILVSKFMGGGGGAASAAHAGGGGGGGGGGGVAGRTPLEHMMEGFMGTLDQEQFNQIMNSGVFKPEQIMGLMEIFKYILERKEAEEKTSRGEKPGPSPGGETGGEKKA